MRFSSHLKWTYLCGALHDSKESVGFIKCLSQIHKLSVYSSRQWTPLLHEPFWHSSFPSPLPNLSCFLLPSFRSLFSCTLAFLAVFPYSHMTFWEQQVTMSAEPFTPCCVSVWCWRSMSSIHKEKPVYFSRSLWHRVSDAEDSQIPVVFAKWLLQFKQKTPYLTLQLFS